MRLTPPLKSFLSFLPIFILLVIIGGVIFRLFAMNERVIMGWIEEPLTGIGRIVGFVFYLFLRLLFLPAELLTYFVLFVMGERNPSGEALFIFALWIYPMYFGLLFALLCVAVRYFAKRKKQTKTPTEPH